MYELYIVDRAGVYNRLLRESRRQQYQVYGGRRVISQVWDEALQISQQSRKLQKQMACEVGVRTNYVPPRSVTLLPPAPHLQEKIQDVSIRPRAREADSWMDNE